MPSWGEVLKEIKGTQVDNPLDLVRWKYLKVLHDCTKRNVISYYSAFLQKNGEHLGIEEDDKNAFMQAVYGLEKSKGLDLILHTPGGDISATESIVKYLYEIFNKDIRVFVPQIAMSAGTMVALASKEIIMGKESSLGPIDPQYGQISCMGVIEEFQNALVAMKIDPSCIPAWQPILSKYHPTFLGDCYKAITWANNMTTQWLEDNMFFGDKDACNIAQKIVGELGNHQRTLSHSRHIDYRTCRQLGLKIRMLEEMTEKVNDSSCKDLQDCVLTIHHTYMHTFSSSAAIKIIENHKGIAMIRAGVEMK